MNARKRSGVTLVEAALAMALIGIILAGMFSLMNDQADRRRAQNTADHLSMVADAAEEYMRVNAHQLRQATTNPNRVIAVPVGRRAVGDPIPSGPSGTTLGSIQGAGYLPASFVDTNGYGQHHFLLLRQTLEGGQPTGRIEGLLVAREGMAIDDMHLGQIASSIGATGGFVPTTPLSGNANRINGSAGGWGSFVSEWQANGIQPVAGRPVVAMALNQDSIVTDFVSRRDVGNPEANRMRTDLSMGEGTNVNSITDVRSLTTTANGEKSIDFVTNSFLTLRNGPSSSLTIRNDGRVDIAGSLRVGEDLTVTNDIRAEGNIAATGNLTAQGNVTATRDIVGERNLSVTGDVSARRLVDRNNANFVVAPAGQSTVNRLSTRYFDLDTRLVNTAGAARPYGTKTDETLGGAVSRLWGCRLEYRFMFSGPTDAALGRPRGFPEGPWVRGPLMDGSSNTGAMSRQYARELDNECDSGGCSVQMRMNCDNPGSTPPTSPTPPVNPEPTPTCPPVSGAVLIGNTPPQCLYEPTSLSCPAGMTQHPSSTASRRICILTITQTVTVPGPSAPPITARATDRLECSTGTMVPGSCRAELNPGGFFATPGLNHVRAVQEGNVCYAETWMADGNVPYRYVRGIAQNWAIATCS